MSEKKMSEKQVVVGQITPHMIITHLDPGCEFRLGDAVAYGTFDPPEYSVDHAPSQEWFDLISEALDKADLSDL